MDGYLTEDGRCYLSRLGYAVDETVGAIKLFFREADEENFDRYVLGVASTLLSPVLVGAAYAASFFKASDMYLERKQL